MSTLARPLKWPPIFPLDKGLVLWLPLDDRSGVTVYDRSGKRNHGTLYGPTWVAGRRGSALSFDGVDDYVQVPIFSLTNKLTILAWVYFIDGSPAGDYGGIIAHLNGFTNKNRLLLKGATEVLFQALIAGAGYNHYFTLPSDQRNAWHFYALVYDGANVRLFWDGSQVGADQPRTGNMNSATTKPTIGWGSTASYYLKGFIDEVRIYNRAPNAAEVKRLYESELMLVRH